jgi:hypothetical protein
VVQIVDWCKNDKLLIAEASELVLAHAFVQVCQHQPGALIVGVCLKVLVQLGDGLLAVVL